LYTELALIGIISPIEISDKWANLPNKVVSVYKSNNGTTTGNSEVNYQYTFNAYGLVVTMKASNEGGDVWKFVYGK
jgi:hypothetical protein